MYRFERAFRIEHPFHDLDRAVAEGFGYLKYTPVPGGFARGRRFGATRSIDPEDMRTEVQVTRTGDLVTARFAIETTGSLRTNFFYAALYAELAVLASWFATGQWDDAPLTAYRRRRYAAGAVFIALGAVLVPTIGWALYWYLLDTTTLLGVTAGAIAVGGGAAAFLMRFVFPQGERALRDGPLTGADGRPHAAAL